MLSLLLDEQISPRVAAAFSKLCPAANIISIYAWRAGALTGVDDTLVLQAAADDGLTLVTYDLKTIPPVLVEWGAVGKSHGGLIFVDASSISPADFGGLARALSQCWKAKGAEEWANRIVYLNYLQK